MTKNNYKKLHTISRRYAVLNSVCSLLEWDQETYMPAGAINLRAMQLEEMSSVLHKQKTSSAFANALAALIDLESGKILDPSLSKRECAALREWRRDYLKAAALPNSFVKKFAKATSEATHKWSLAKEKSDFKLFLPHLENIIKLVREKSELLGYKKHPYDALLDLYEPELTTEIVTPLFSSLKNGLTELLEFIEKKEEPKRDFLGGEFAKEKQLEFGKMLLKEMGFDPTISRLDQSSHPFCMGLHPQDTRMTTKIHLDNPLSSIFSVIHEGGHGLYNMQLPEEDFGSPLGEQISMGIDESQSRWWETRIGRSYPFWQYFLPRLQNVFPSQLKGVSLDDFYKAINHVKRAFIRVEADEVTYSLHVILRYEIEKGLVEGSLKAKDIPEAWNEKMKKLLGISPRNDSEGCLQDIHWSMGGFGYFPSYTLGNLYAAGFFAAFEKNHPNWKERLSRGELEFIRAWLKENIHQYGREYTPKEIVKKITGQSLSEKPYLEYLMNKYQQLYGERR